MSPSKNGPLFFFNPPPNALIPGSASIHASSLPCCLRQLRQSNSKPLLSRLLEILPQWFIQQFRWNFRAPNTPQRRQNARQNLFNLGQNGRVHVRGWGRVVFLEAESDGFVVHDVGTIGQAHGGNGVGCWVQRRVVGWDSVSCKCEQRR